MIQLNRRTEIPNIRFAEYSFAEYKKAESQIASIEQISEDIWSLDSNGDPLLVAGIIRPSLLARPRLWFLLALSFMDNTSWHLRLLREMTKELDKRYGTVETSVQADWDVGLRFARFCGFRPTGQLYSFNDVTYMVLER